MWGGKYSVAFWDTYIFQDDVQPWHLYDPKTPLHYTVNRVKAFTKEVATKSSAPFLHRYLYKSNTPQCILTCFTTCVLYENRTPANIAMVIRALHGNIRELIDFEAGRITATPTEKLARTQALFLYQIMRLFDDNITLRSQAERDMPILEKWLDELCKIRENLGNLEDDARRQKPVEWEVRLSPLFSKVESLIANWFNYPQRWIFAESVRRTIVMAYSVIVLYSMMKTPDDENGEPHRFAYLIHRLKRGTDDPGPWAFTHRWTLSRPLWEASSSFEFNHLWRETPQFVISNYSFDTFLKHGRGEDVDEFAEILMTVSVAESHLPRP